ncbi:MAG: BREX-1 system adenine-specific DNA-methyltransferase PglX [Firmicutes bacterium]|nr:BREX-1 system adenine-specific DNA-methyltransferase PglX [Bacillota bacterium]
MNKTAIQKYAVWARNELIGQVKQRAFQYGISEEGYGEENAAVVAGRVLSTDEKRQRQGFVDEIKKYGYRQAVEKAAYTWFNRFIALRFMEVNDYLPTHVRVFSDAAGSFNPEILKEALRIDLPGLDPAKVRAFIDASDDEGLYRYLLLTQCNALSGALPEMFQQMGGYTELLLPNNILKQDSVLARLVLDIDAGDWHDAVQIIGWMYQYYNTEPKQAVFDGLKKNIKITKEKIPAATQLFTPDWIVRYMVENSLGRLWLENHPDAALRGKPLQSYWKYYLAEAEQTPEVTRHLCALRSLSPVKSPEDVRFIDPCMGSGHILVYAFDVLLQIYESEGVGNSDAARLILEKNLHGLDIDPRAYQLAYFALMMKARKHNRRILRLGVAPQVYHPEGFADGEEYGSLKIDDPGGIPAERIGYDNDLRVWNFKRLLTLKYDCVVTNPPYMGGKGQSGTTAQFLKDNYPDTKSDTFSAFIERCGQMASSTGYVGMFTPYVWMFIQSYEKLRNMLYSTKDIITLIQFEYSAFEEATVPVCSFVVRNGKTGASGEYLRLVDYRGGMEVQRVKALEAIANPNCGYRYTASTENFEKIPGWPVAYWVSEAMLRAFIRGKTIEEIADVKHGMSTGKNEVFVREWWEIKHNEIDYNLTDKNQLEHSTAKYYPYNKGGEYRLWYGNAQQVVLYGSEGRTKMLTYSGFRHDGKEWYFRKGITWSFISSSKFGVRLSPTGFVFDVAGSSLFPKPVNILYLLGFLSSKICFTILMSLNPTLNFQVGNIKSIPVILDAGRKPDVDDLVTTNVSLSRSDWDAFETSWDFKRHPLVNGEASMAAAFGNWEREAAERFETLKANEEELNRIFIGIYGLQDELTPEVEDKDVTVRRADLGRDIRSFISYAVGCMFGRYSLDEEGLVFAGGGWDDGKYKTFQPDADNVLPICDDEYFDDDIAGRFAQFVEAVYGAQTLEENLKFIADALGGKGTPREVIRNYFLNDFYKDHCKIYQKRPIYWLFDSGKKHGFKALVYLHRYSRDLLARLRTDYVHEQQERYRTQLSHIAVALHTAAGTERARLLKQQDKLSEQALELGAYEEKIHHLADRNIEIDLDDGVKKNYELFADVLAKI